MKNVIIITCWMFFAFTKGALAQEETNQPVLKDTFVIHLQGTNQVQIVGRSLRYIKKYDRLDTLKDLFITDLQTSWKNEALPAGTKTIHYLVSPTGKRRLKATSPEMEGPVDIKKEKKRLLEDLPSYHYIIYDLAKDIEIHFYMEDSSAIISLRQSNLSSALHEKAKYLSWKYRYDADTAGKKVENKNSHDNRDILFGAMPSLGVVLIGNQLSPLVGDEAVFVWSNRYNTKTFKLGFLFNAFMLTDYKEARFSNVTVGKLINGSIAFNMFDRSKEAVWLGFQFGKITLDNAISGKSQAYTYGMYFAHKVICSIDLVKNLNGNDMYMLTVRLPLF